MKKTITEYLEKYEELKNQQNNLPPGDKRAKRAVELDKIHRGIMMAENALDNGRSVHDILDRIHQLISSITN